jgi:tetratricopeptide (TPR) repeat protein
VETAAAPLETAYAMAVEYLSKGMLDRAAAEVNRALVRGANTGEGLILLGDIFLRQGLHGEALERYKNARTVTANAPRALAGETRALLLLGRSEQARAVAEELLLADPSTVESILLVASARADAGDPAAARELLKNARRLAPARADVLRQFGDVARAAGDVEGAIAAYKNALDLDPDVAVVHYELGRLLAEKDDATAAETELLAALDAVPTYVEATLALAQVRRRFGRAKDALSPLVDLLRRDPYNVEALLVLAETLLELDRPRDAAISIERVLRFDPRNVGALFLHGVLLADQHRYREAIGEWERVVELEPDGEFGKNARREMRTASDLLRIFRHRQEAS